MKNLWISILFVLLAASACDRVKNPIPAYTEQIFHLEIGQERIYFVIDTTYTTSDTVVDRYYRLERIVDTEEDLTGRTLFRVEYLRSEEEDGPGGPYAIEAVIGKYRDENFAEVIENSQRVRVLKFPVYRGIRWNANLFNGQNSQEYRYQSIDTSFSLGGLTYDPVVFVMNSLASDSLSRIRYRVAYTLYAPEKGKIYQYDRTIVNDRPTSTGEPGFNPDDSYTHVEMLIE